MEFRKHILIANVLSLLLAGPVLAEKTPTSASAVDREALAQVLLAEIAMREHRMPEAWNAYMRAAERVKDPVLAERAYALAQLARDPASAERSKELLNTIAPDNALISIDNALQQAKNGNWKHAKELLIKALKASKTPLPFLQEFASGTQSLPDLAPRYQALQDAYHTIQSEAKAELLLAQCAFAAKLQKEAVEHALSAAKLAPDDPQILLESANFQFALDPKATQERLQAYLKRHPKEFQVMIALAKAMVQTKQVPQGIELLKKAVASDNNNPKTLFFAAVVSEEAKDYGNAEKWLKRYIKLLAMQDNNSFLKDPAYVRLGAIAIARNQREEALSWLAKVKAGPQYTAAQITRAQLLESLHRVDESCRVLQDIRTDKIEEKASYRNTCAKIFAKANRKKDALKALQEAVHIAPKHTATLYESAETAHIIGEYAKAEQLLRQYIAIDPDSPHGYNALGYMWLERGVRTEEAAPLVEKAYKINKGKDGSIVDSMGWLRYRQGRLEEAETFLETALKKQNDLEIVLHLAQVQFERGKKAEAKTTLQRILRRFPKHPEANALLKRVEAP